MRSRLAAPALAVAFAVAPTADGAVSALGPGGFAVKFETTVNASPESVYDALASQLGVWWSSEHTYSGDAKNMSIDARAGGCFCERLKDGSIEHARVVYAVRGRALRLSGALGPLQAHGVAGSMTWRLALANGATKLEMTYSAGGFMEGGFDKMAPLVDGVLGEQFQRLKLFVETGKPVAGN